MYQVEVNILKLLDILVDHMLLGVVKFIKLVIKLLHHKLSPINLLLLKLSPIKALPLKLLLIKPIRILLSLVTWLIKLIKMPLFLAI